MNEPLTFGKEERLCGKTSIASLIKNGHWIVEKQIRACWSEAPEEQTCSRLLVSVPKKFFKRAVKRNTLKRRMRESYRKSKNILGDKKVNLMLVWSCKELADSTEIYEQINQILKRISK